MKRQRTIWIIALVTVCCMFTGGCFNKKVNPEEIITEPATDKINKTIPDQSLMGPDVSDDNLMKNIDLYVDGLFGDNELSDRLSYNFFIYYNKFYIYSCTINQAVLDEIEKEFLNTCTKEEREVYEKVFHGSEEELQNMPDAEFAELLEKYMEISEKYNEYVEQSYPNLWEENEQFIDKIVSVNLDGTDFRFIAEDKLLRGASFQCACGNYAYMYNLQGEALRVNLLTGEVCKMAKNYRFFGDVSDGCVKAMIQSDNVDKPFCGFYLYDLVNDKELVTREIEAVATPFIDYDNMDMYYIRQNDRYDYCLGVNGEDLYTFEKGEGCDIILGVKGNYIYSFGNGALYKIDVESKTADVTYEDYGYLSYVSSGGSGGIYLRNDRDNCIYTFDADTGKMEVLFETEEYFTKVSRWNGKQLFTDFYDNTVIGVYNPDTAVLRIINADGMIFEDISCVYCVEVHFDEITWMSSYDLVRVDMGGEG